jgi:large subunit ribosomal protein L10
MKSTHVSDKKKKTVDKLTKLIKKYSNIGIVDMENLPAKQLQNIKEKLRDRVVLIMAKKRIMRIALENAKNDKEGVQELEEHMKGMPAFIMTDQSPFQLFKTLKKNKSNAPAKPGQEAPNDIKVSAGPTPFAPGPIIGELGKFGIKTKIENNKINITEEKVVVKEGEEIGEKLAGILTRLDIKPIEVGLNLIAVYEKGEILTKDILDIDEEEYINNLKMAHSEAFKLAGEIAYPIKGIIEMLISKARNNARTLAMEQEIINEETRDVLVKKAESDAGKLKQKVPEEVKASDKEETEVSTKEETEVSTKEETEVSTKEETEVSTKEETEEVSTKEETEEEPKSNDNDRAEEKDSSGKKESDKQSEEKKN